MTVSTELQRIKTAIDNAYNAAEAKGETIPEVESSENLATTISSITPNLQTGENFGKGVYVCMLFCQFN